MMLGVMCLQEFTTDIGGRAAVYQSQSGYQQDVAESWASCGASCNLAEARWG